MTARRLIINADDFGRTAGINEGILLAHKDGVVTSTTLMVNYPAAREAVARAREHSRLGVGLHLALTGGPPALPADRLPSLLNSKGQLPAKPDGLSASHSDEIRAESRAQLAKFRDLMGHDPTHFDSHHHSHRTPMVFDAIVELARETGRPVRAAAPGMADRLRRAGVATIDHFVEEFFGEGARLETLTRIIDGLNPGVTEVMCHPAVVDDELRRSSGYADERTGELRALTHSGLREQIESRGIELIHYGQL